MKLKVLGSGQDAGIPHTACYCSICARARREVAKRRLGPSIALISKKKAFCYLIDASPDFKVQLDAVRKECSCVRRKGKIPVSGIFLTHAHMGHYSGLWQLGKETLDEKNVPVYCTPLMKQFLSLSFPFNYLVQAKNILIQEIHTSVILKLDGFYIAPVPVPHRNEFADTVGYIVQAKKRVVYIPDIDFWTDELIRKVNQSDIALIDGTFFSKSELPRFMDVPHPPIRETLKLFKGSSTEIFFTHINHTNVINKNGKELKDLKKKGYRVARDGLTLEI